MSDDELVFTREDADRMTKMESKLDTIIEKIDVLNQNLGKCQLNCASNRTIAAKRLDVLERCENERTAADKQTIKIAGIVSGVVTFVILVADFAITHFRGG